MVLPTEVRDSLIVLLEEFLEDKDDAPDALDIATLVVSNLEPVAEEAGVDNSDELIRSIEDAMEMDDSLRIIFQDELERLEDLAITAEEILALFARITRITWEDEADLDELDELDDFEEDNSSLFDEES